MGFTPEQQAVEARRTEADSKRACFRDYSIKAVGWGTTGAIAMAGIAAKVPVIGWSSPALVILVAAVMRIGIHKFSSANRLYGYQLHLERLGTGDKPLSEIGWEQMCRAWRIVQATLYRSIHEFDEDRHRSLFFDDLDTEQHREFKKYHDAVPAPWWRQDRRARDNGAFYHAGSYLDRMFGILRITQYVALFPIVIAVGSLTWQIVSAASAIPVWVSLTHATALLAWGVLTVFYFIIPSSRVVEIKRKNLEFGFLSIHSCALVWRGVAMAHSLAWQSDKPEPKQGPADYTEQLAIISARLAANPLHFRDWIGLPKIPPDIFIEPLPIDEDGSIDTEALREQMNKCWQAQFG
ncbi:MAG: hypothetical protein ED559_06185 [Phycisphaera sp.]|nr:MAG: hypothetical protein ED559_06185 [Phycisphaera sp.]